jgi:hypothetical protein
MTFWVVIVVIIREKEGMKLSWGGDMVAQINESWICSCIIHIFPTSSSERGPPQVVLAHGITHQESKDKHLFILLHFYLFICRNT